MRMAWSPNFTNEDFSDNYEDWTFEDKIRLFEDQVLGWQLLIADDIININGAKNRHAGFAVLSMILSYFEMIGMYLKGYTGEKGSRKHFKFGLVSVFPYLKDENEVVDVLYGDARCGMYHEALIGKRIILTRNYEQPIYVINKEYSIIAIDPHSLTTALIKHFRDYVNLVKSSDIESVVSQNFITKFDFIKRSKANVQKNFVTKDLSLLS